MRNRLLLATSLALVLSGCRDTAGAGLNPAPVVPRFSAEYGEFPWDPPKPDEWPVKITHVFAEAEWPTAPSASSYRTVNLMAYMYFNGYHASIAAEGTMHERDGAHPPCRFTRRVKHSDRFYNNFHRVNLPVLTRSSCGAALQADVAFQAWWWGVNLEGTPMPIQVDDDAAAVASTQEACEPCPAPGGGSPIQDHVSDADYDAYDPEPSSGDCESGGGGGGSWSGSGTQYSEGDYTGGETVDWGTGQGNGGSSACGEAAQVQYVCIDVFIEGAWQQYSCGWVTTC